MAVWLAVLAVLRLAIGLFALRPKEAELAAAYRRVRTEHLLISGGGLSMADGQGEECVISLPHERFGTTWAFDQIGFDLVELPEVVTWPQSSKERPSRK